MGPKRLAELPNRFRGTPIYEETIREAMMEKVDLPTVKQIMQDVKEGKVKVHALLRLEKPTPLAFHILAKYAEVPELMAPEKVLLSNIERMKRSILARKASLLCLSCGAWSAERRIRELPEKPTCERCGAGLLASLRLGKDPERLRDALQRRLKGEEVPNETLEDLTYARRTADLVLSHGKRALIALEVKGVGPETAFRILGKMHPREDDFYMDLLKAKIQYLRTRPYWEDERQRPS